MELNLQTLLKQLFGVDVPILRCKENPLPTAETCIIATNDGGYGNAWSGYVCTQTVTLENFIRPDTGKSLVFRFLRSDHDLSGQIDCWEGEIDNILPAEYDAFLHLVHIDNAGLYPSNHLHTKVYINGERVKMLAREKEAR